MLIKAAAADTHLTALDKPRIAVTPNQNPILRRLAPLRNGSKWRLRL